MYNDLLLERLGAALISGEDDRIEELIEEIETLQRLLSPEAQALIRDLRPRIVTDDVYDEFDERASFGERLADKLAAFAGSWRFIVLFAPIVGLWIAVNAYLGTRSFDPFPFILLNLTLSTLAALQAAVILMSQHRQATKDRAVAQNDYHLKGELELADLHRKVDTLAMQTRLVNALVEARRKALDATIRAMSQARKDDAHN